jgi:hypothetical protein
MRKAPANRNRAEYEVGWGRPPKSTRFKPGQSGNPRGRPRPKKDQSAFLREALEQNLQIAVRGKMHTISALEAIYRLIVNLALKGELKAVKLLLEMYAMLPENTKSPEKLSADTSLESLAETYFKMVRQVR